ncbi:ionotropic receptor 21a isoform X2 [Apis florea]|uniref:ionotropic receptor 21a isoform X2 n=1 Tax=Apis florea TaxID=7463 RepID=UPI0012FF0395|nr:ionotropic receptor 21a isoform X2 [Apis florea]
MLLVTLFLQIILVSGKRVFYKLHQCENNEANLKSLAEKIVEEIIEQTNCIIFVTDSIYQNLIDIKNIKGSSNVSKYEILLRDNEQFLRPRRRIQRILVDGRTVDCNAYIMLISNGYLTAEFLQYTERERLINTHGLFLLLYDSRLFQLNLYYLWKKIINVVFIRQYNAYKHRSGEILLKEKIDLNTVYFPPRKKRLTATKYIDTWYQGKLRYGTNHFTEKTNNLQKKHLQIAVFEHIPAVTEKIKLYYNKQPNNIIQGLGIEFELIQIISKAMNFKPKYYIHQNIPLKQKDIEGSNQTDTGLISKAIEENAAFYLESLTENSWKLLILPFKFYTWIALILTLILGSIVFYFLSLSYKKHISSYKSQNTSIKNEMKGLYLFTEIGNSILYTYSMLFQVSLPHLPSPWAVRILIGWWWIYSILVAVAYRASMTATLANPVARVTIDTLAQLAKSSMEVGGLNEESKNFFLKSSDLSSQEIGNKFMIIKHEDEAIEKVANGSFCYYENSYLLQYARVKRQIIEKEKKRNETANNISSKHNLHIMEECIINMPTALGMEKNSPLKPKVDNLIRRMIEIGLVQKWLNDVMEWPKIMEIRQEAESEKALVNLHKLQGAFFAIISGYLLAFMILISEILHWKYIVLKDPKFDKYHLDIFYNSNNNSKI